MTGEQPWYVLEFDEGARVTAGGGAVEVTSFRGPLSTRDGEVRFSLRLWRAPVHPDLMPEAERNAARESCVLAVGSAGALAVELRGAGARYRVGRRDTENSPARTIQFNLGHQVTVHEDEVFAAPEAGELFLTYFKTGTVPTGQYRLRELTSPVAPESPTHALTVNFDQHRPVLPTVAAEEFQAFLSEDDGPSVLVLWPLPPGKTLAELTGDELELHEEFIQTAGSAGRYTVEVREADTVHTLGHVVDYLVWGTEPTEIAVGSDTVPVYPNEVFTPAEVGAIFHRYATTSGIAQDAYLRRENQ
jgi:hypothetical protein